MPGVSCFCVVMQQEKNPEGDCNPPSPLVRRGLNAVKWGQCLQSVDLARIKTGALYCLHNIKLHDMPKNVTTIVPESWSKMFTK